MKKSRNRLLKGGKDMAASQKKTVITVIVMAVIAAAVIFGYYRMTQNMSGEEEAAVDTEAGKLLQKDMENNYPGTPREVLKLYGRITKCMYNDELNQKQIEGLLEQARKLYDDELLANNTWDSQLEALVNDIADYKNNDRVVMSYTAQKSSQVKTYEKDGREYALTYMLFITSEKTIPYTESYQRFLMRKDTSGKWKIVGWDLVDPDTVEIEVE